MNAEWEKAREAGARLFHETYSNTIRVCPHNYCIAIYRGMAWVADVDAALGDYVDIMRQLVADHNAVEPAQLIAILTPHLPPVGKESSIAPWRNGSGHKRAWL